MRVRTLGVLPPLNAAFSRGSVFLLSIGAVLAAPPRQGEAVGTSLCEFHSGKQLFDPDSAHTLSPVTAHTQQECCNLCGEGAHVIRRRHHRSRHHALPPPLPLPSPRSCGLCSLFCHCAPHVSHETVRSTLRPLPPTRPRIACRRARWVLWR